MSEMERVFIGIDPGKDGAMAIVAPSETIVAPYEKSSYIEHLHAVKDFTKDIRCVVEHVGAMPGQGSVSMFHFGENFGWIQGVLDSMKIPYELVRPQKWKKEFSCTSDKNTSIQVAQRLFPYVDLRRTMRCSKPHDGICEALLMAEYARRKLNG